MKQAVKVKLQLEAEGESRAAPALGLCLPEPFAAWFARRGWRPHAHQLQLLKLAEERRDTLLIAPTGAGKTLAGFLPSLVDLACRPARRKPETAIHTLYVSPLKALAVDIARNLAAPVAEMELPMRLETRTGDTPPSRRARQRILPPDILLTTPEQIALMLSHKGASELFGSLKFVILDELHALASSKRGDLLALDPHALCLAAKGARRRYRPEPLRSRRGDEASYHPGNANRRHAALPPRAPAPIAARHLAHDAGTACTHAVAS